MISSTCTYVLHTTLDDHRYHGCLCIALLKPLHAAAGLEWQPWMTTGTMVT